MEEAMPAKGYSLPIKKSLPKQADEFSEWLQPTPFIQSDHPRIKKAAKKAVGEADDAVMATDMLLAWISKEVEPSLVVSIPFHPGSRAHLHLVLQLLYKGDARSPS